MFGSFFFSGTSSEELENVVGRVASPLYQRAFETVTKETFAVTGGENYDLLQNGPNLITWYNGDQRPAIVERIRRAHSQWFAQWLTEYCPTRPIYRENKNLMELLILHLTNMLFRLDLEDAITSDQTREDFQHIADVVKQCLLTIEQSNLAMDAPTILFVQHLLQILFYFSVDNGLALHLKSLNLVEMINTLLETSNHDNEIQLHAYRILAVLMSEADIKKLQNAPKIAEVFITYIAETMDGGTRTEGRFHNNLRSLTVLTQHDEVRDELIKQKGYELFLRVVLEEHFNLLKAKLPSLRILLTLSFNEGFANTLRENQALMKHVEELRSSAAEEIQRIASALLWKLKNKPEKEETVTKTSPQPSTGSKKLYDVMISYSHNDKELCHQISQRLQDEKLRIWVDFQQIHGNMADVIAEAIENSEVVLVCMSDTYKQSSVCKSEATYAAKRGCHIIPLVMTPHYKADGWLGFLTSALIYVDFKKVAFDNAFAQLKNQMQRMRAHPGQEAPAQGDHSALTLTAPRPSPPGAKSIEPPAITEFPPCVDQWTEEHVRAFLIGKKLHALLGAFEGMNGRLLHRAYHMCLSNQQAMFSSLKEDAAQSPYKTAVSLKDYLLFMEEIKAYVPHVAGAPTNPASAVCSLM